MKFIPRRAHRRWRPGHAAFAMVAALLLGACSDAVGPASVASVRLQTQSSLTLTVGESVALMAEVQDAQGNALAGRAVTWTTSNQAVATVEGNGIVTATGAGLVTIAASHGGFRDSVLITVLGAGNGCEASSFGIGEVRPLTPGTDGRLCLPAAGSYTLVVTNTARTGNLALNFSGSGLTTPSSSLRLSSAVDPFPAAAIGGNLPTRDWAAESDIRARERAALRGREQAAREAARTGPADTQLRMSITPGVPTLGALLRLNVSIDACGPPDERIGRVMNVSRTTIVVADTANPRDGFTDADFRHVGATMDSLVVPVVTESFGSPADIDSNSRVILFYTRAVNEMTAEGEDSYIGGFFYSRDLFPTRAANGVPGCAGSNVGEIMYMLAPDPTGEVNGNRRTREFVEQRTMGVAAHELQHLVNASRRLFVVEADNFDEEVWLNEGLSHIAEELVFYRSSGLTPGNDLALSDLRASVRRVNAFNLFAGDNFLRLMEHLKAPSTSSPYGSDDALSTRGAIWSFLRYLADRRGGDQIAFWQSLVDTRSVGMTNLRTAIGADPLALVHDWSVANFSDNAVSQTPAFYTHPSWNFRSVYSGFGSTGGYPLALSTIGDGSSFSITAGGSIYLPVATARGAPGELRILAGGRQPPSSVRVAAVRTR